MSIIYINPYRFASAPAYDADAQDFINRVIAADVAAGNSSGLEVGVQDAYNAFVVGCKADGIWSAIKASCILAGARTLSGALVPLVGAAPTNSNFVAGDYNRKTGLVGDGSTKSLNSNRNNNADPQNSKHIAVYASTVDTRSAFRGYIGCQYNTGWTSIASDSSSYMTVWVNSWNSPLQTISNQAGLLGASRNSSTTLTARSAGTTQTFTKSSQTPGADKIIVIASNAGGERSNARIAFYSIGEALDLALLDARVTALINAIAAVIP